MKKIIDCVFSLLVLIATVILLLSVYFYSTKVSYPWYFDKLNIIENRSIDKNNKIGVAIIDSGFNDTCKKYFNNEVIKYDATGENNTDDLTGHGTQMALLIGSNSTKRNSVYGINPNVQIYSVRVCNSYGITSSDNLHKALEYCKKIDVSVVNISLGGTTYNATIEKDIEELKNENVFVICAAGDKKTEFLYPADYFCSYCVVSQKEDGTIYEDSNYISKINKKALLAPGCNIDVLTIGIENEMNITSRSGSSYATAIFSGYLTLFIVKNNITTQEFDFLIESNIYNNGFLSFFC